MKHFDRIKWSRNCRLGHCDMHLDVVLGRPGGGQLTSLGMRTKSEIEILNGQSAIDIDGVC